MSSDAKKASPSLSKFSISKITKIFSAGILAGMIAAVAVNQYALHEVTIGSDRYNQIVDGKDVIADILPPPLYIVEAYLEARIILENTDEYEARKANFVRMKTEFDGQQAKWLQSTLPDNIRVTLTRDSHAAATKFWKELNSRFLPAIETGKRADAAASMKKLHEFFQEHRRIVVQIVANANDFLVHTEAETASLESGLIVTSIVLSLLTLAALILSVFQMRKVVTKPLDRITSRMNALAKGDYDSEIPYSHKGNEIGDIARALEKFRAAAFEKIEADAALEKEREQADANRRKASEDVKVAVEIIGKSLGELADGNLATRVTDQLSREYSGLATDFNSAVEKLQNTMTSVVAGMGSIDSGNSEVAVATNDLSRRTEHQAAALEETAASVAEITESVQKSSVGAERAREISTSTQAEAEQSGQIVSSAVTAMSEIEKSADEINDIIGVMDEIAFQTNLLALNAGVEAARAGDAGRGFAVVASEVRALAERSATAARQVQDLISTSTTQVKDGVRLVKSTGEALDRISKGVVEINSVVSEITDGTRIQAESLGQVNSAVSQLDQVTQENAAMVEEASAATRQLATQSSELTNIIGGFRLGTSTTPQSATTYGAGLTAAA